MCDSVRSQLSAAEIAREISDYCVLYSIKAEKRRLMVTDSLRDVECNGRRLASFQKHHPLRMHC